MGTLGVGSRRTLAGLLMAGQLLACSDRAGTEVAIGIPTPSRCADTRGDAYWFPQRAGRSEADQSDIRLTRPAEFLQLLAEPSLWCEDSPESYRLLRYFPHWGPPQPEMIRVTRTGPTGELIAASLDGGDGESPLAVGERTRRTLSVDDWAALSDAIDQSRFWSAPPLPASPRMVLDGDTWLLEGRRQGIYRSLILSPFLDDAQFARLAATFYKHAGISIPEELRSASPFVSGVE